MMRWNRLILSLIIKPQIQIPFQRLNSLTQLNYLSFGSCVACCQCHHTLHPKLNNKSTVINKKSSILIAGFDFPSHYTYVWTRGYAKGKDRGRDKKKTDKGKKKVEVNDEQLAEVIKVETMRTQMQKALDLLKEEYVKNLSLRSTTGSLETIPVSFEGKEYELQELAQVVRKNPKTLIINMSSFPQTIPAVLQSIQKSGLNLNPQQDGTTLFIPIPKVTKEHRENLAKNAKALLIKCKDSIRDVQIKYVKNVKNNTTISQDLAFNIQEQIVALGDLYISEGKKIYETKQAELIGKD